MRKLIEYTLITLDGVIGDPKRWSNFDAESAALALKRLDDFDAYVMGRAGYEYVFAGLSGSEGNPYLDRLNEMPKYVASQTLAAPPPNVTLLGPDVADAIRSLKEQPGKDLIKYGTSSLDALLLEERLLDELHLWYMPVVFGAGRRLFDGVDASALTLLMTDEHRLTNGSVVLSYAVL
ncbi:MAG TPA: dihydrofolate reductase family protein [Gaiellaceae bacterium]|nr:dihydrofolate reductase family protein [Gaiellaceae bacterium]